MRAPKIGVFLLGVISAVLLSMIFNYFRFSSDIFTTTILSVWIRVRVFFVPSYLFLTVNFIIFVLWILSEHHQSIDRKQKRKSGSTSIEISSSVVPMNQTDQYLFLTETQLQIPSLSQCETKSDMSCVTTDVKVVTIRKHNAVVNRIPNPEPPPAPTVEEEEEKSMDATWNTIMAPSLAKQQFKRSHTCKESKEVEKVNSPKVVGVNCRAVMKKSETFHDSRGRAPVLRINDAVLVGKDELNRQVDDFIKKFNDDLRLQRQESHQRYIDKVNRGMSP